MNDKAASITLFQLDYIMEMTLTPLQRQILTILSHSMQTELPDAPMETATMLDDLCPPTHASDDDMEGYLWNVWNLMVQIAISPNSTDSMQECLVKVIQCLATIAKGQVTIYGVSARTCYHGNNSMLILAFLSRESTVYGEIFPCLPWRWMLLAVVGILSPLQLLILPLQHALTRYQ